jgi:hypothetical protein
MAFRPRLKAGAFWPCSVKVKQWKAPLTHGRALKGWIMGALVLLSACSPQSSAIATPTAHPNASTSASATSDACAVQGQKPPSANVSASHATALAFASDGRLFWAERSGTVKVWQDGAPRTIATVQTVTTERG